MDWFEPLLVMLVAATAIGCCALAADPAGLCRWWGPAIVVLVMWPFALSQHERNLLGVPLEYLPLLFLVFSSTLSALFRHGFDWDKMHRWPLLCSSAVLLYGVVSLSWTWSYSGWLREFSMFAGYFVWFHVVSAALRRQGLERLLTLLEWLVYWSAAFACIGCLRVFLTPGRYVGDFTPIIEYRSSEVMAVYSAAFLALALYAIRGHVHLLAAAAILWASLFLTFSRTGMVGHGLATLLLVALSWCCQGWSGERVRHTAIILGIGCLVFGGLICVASPRTLDALVQRASSIDLAFEIFGDDELQARKDDGGRRATLLRLSLQLHDLHPWKGVGMGGYHRGVTTLTDDEYLWARSHNFYSSYLAEFGWIGFVPLMAFLLWFPWEAGRTLVLLRFGSLRILAATVLASSAPILVMMVAQEFVSAPYIWLYWTLSAAVLGAAVDYQTQHADGLRQPRAVPAPCWSQTTAVWRAAR